MFKVILLKLLQLIQLNFLYRSPGFVKATACVIVDSAEHCCQRCTQRHYSRRKQTHLRNCRRQFFHANEIYLKLKMSINICLKGYILNLLHKTIT